MAQIIHEKDWKKSIWDGGETNELFLFPKDGNYKSRKFKARISIATSNNAEKSVFTSLPGIDRFISKLEGNLEITHEDRYHISLEQYEIDHFCGDWTSYSYGVFRDFNLMIQGGTGDLKFTTLNGEKCFTFPSGVEFCFIYIISGAITFDQNNCNANELLILEQSEISIIGKEAKLFYGFFKE